MEGLIMINRKESSSPKNQAEVDHRENILLRTNMETKM
jgi:hypothetical protein